MENELTFSNLFGMNVSSNRVGLRKKQPFLPFLALILYLGPQSIIHAQSTLQIDLIPVYGYQMNIYGAPNDVQFLGPDSLESDTVFVSDYFHEEQLSFAFLFENKQHKIRWENNALFRTYRDLKSANTLNFNSSLNYRYESEDWFFAAGEVRLGSYEEVGLDLISTDLLIPQSRTELFLQFSAGIQSDQNVLLVTPRFHRARYEACLSCFYEETLPSLSHNMWSFGVSDTIFIGKGATQQRFAFGVSFGNQQFIDWDNTMILDPGFPGGAADQFLPFNPDVSYNPHHWRFISASAVYSFPINKNSRVVPFLNYEQRGDLGKSDFGRNDLNAGMRLQLRTKKLRIDGKISYSNQQFTDRLTGSDGSVSVSSLRYRIIQSSASVSYKLGGALFFHAGGGYAKRSSTEQRTTTIVRRPYENWSVFGGLRILIETERSGNK
ncbi:MAG: hypothetical protein ACJAU0_000416 [Flavobacteriales bacterium]